MKTVAGVLAAVAMVTAAHADEDLLTRGSYLVNTVMACGNCHTPQGPGGPDVSRTLAGGMPFFDAAFDVYASNITQDAATGIGAWSDDDIKRALQDGVRPDGTKLAPIMPFVFYKVLSERDLDAVVAYLRTVEPVANEVPAPSYKIHIEAHPLPGAETAMEEDARVGDQVAEGFYLATIAHCMECHIARPNGMPDPVHGMGAGGMKFPGPWGESVAANISSHPEEGIGAWSDEEVTRAIREGVSRDGRPLMPPMAFWAYADMKDEDVAAIVAWLRTLPPAPSAQ